MKKFFTSALCLLTSAFLAGAATTVSQLLVTNRLTGGSLIGPVSVPTNGVPNYVSRAVALSNLSVKLMSPETGGNYWSDMTNSLSTFPGQIGISYSGDTVPHLWFADGVGTGTNVWGRPVSIPGGFTESGSEWTAAAKSIGKSSTYFYFNGSPSMATAGAAHLGAAYYDSGVYSENVNPFGSISFFGTPRIGTNVIGSLIGTNNDGVRIYRQDPFGMVLGSIPDAYPVGETNQAGSYVIIFNPTPLSCPFYISVNGPIPGDDPGVTWQRGLIALDTRFFVNSAINLGGGFPLQVANVASLTNALYKWTAFFDEINGTVSITNGPLRLGSNLLSTATSKASTIFGGAQDSTAMFNINGSVSLNDHGNGGIFTNVFAIDAAETHRFGFVSRQGNYTAAAHGSGSPWRVVRSSAADMIASAPTQTFTEEFEIASDGQSTFKTNLLANTGIFFPSNAVTQVSQITSGMTNGAFWTGTLSNALQSAWMSNNVVLWKRLAP